MVLGLSAVQFEAQTEVEFAMWNADHIPVGRRVTACIQSSTRKLEDART